MFCFPSNIGLISSLKAAFISLYSGYFNSHPFFSKFSVLGEGVVFVGDFFLWIEDKHIYLFGTYIQFFIWKSKTLQRNFKRILAIIMKYSYDFIFVPLFVICILSFFDMGIWWATWFLLHIHFLRITA